jgi:imidazolonepropionase-like amidohydrolase
MRTAIAALLLASAASLNAQVAIYGETVYTMAGAPIKNGVVLVNNGKIEQAGPASAIKPPEGYRMVRAKVVTPGLIDAHTVVGLSGYQNQSHDQDQIERSAPSQPDLRAIDGYDARERLVEWVRSFGVTTIHTGHGPGALISGQTMIAKTAGSSAEQAAVVPAAMIAATLGQAARAEQGKAPGTRAKMIAMLRNDLVKASAYVKKQPETRDLRLEALAPVVKGEMPLLVTVHRNNDILSAIRLGKEFNVKLVLDGVADAHMVLDEIKASGFPVIIHPTMARAFGETENLSMETASKLREKGIPFALQSGFESYVPKTRLVLWEAGVAAANGLSFEHALSAVTIDAARLLGIDKRAGSIEPGKDADIAMYDGDPFEYTTHCTGVVVGGVVFDGEKHAGLP